MPLKVVGFWDANVVATPPSKASSLTFTLQLGNANLVVVYNHKKMMFCYEHLQKMMEKFQGKVLNLPLFCAIVSEQGEPCKNENASNSVEFVARTVTKEEALGDFRAKYPVVDVAVLSVLTAVCLVPSMTERVY